MFNKIEAKVVAIVAGVLAILLITIFGIGLYNFKYIGKDDASNVILTVNNKIVDINEMSDEELFNAIQSDELRIDQLPEERVEAAYAWDEENAGGIQHPELDAVYDILVGYHYDEYMNNVKAITGKMPNDIVVDTNETNDYYIVTWYVDNYLGTFCGSDTNTSGTVLKQLGEYKYETVLDWKPGTSQ